MTLFKKKLIIILSFIFVSLLGIFLVVYFENKSIESINNRIDLVKEGMSSREVIELLGKPETEEWIESSILKLSDEIKEKYKRVYILQYEFYTFLNKIMYLPRPLNSHVISTMIVLDKKEGKVISEIYRYLGDIGMIPMRLGPGPKNRTGQ